MGKALLYEFTHAIFTREHEVILSYNCKHSFSNLTLKRDKNVSSI
jgi:hypothetical protein